VQITEARHATKTDCAVGVAALGNTCCDILVMVCDPANKIFIECPVEAAMTQGNTILPVQFHH
jgi:hypothetical protein